MNTSLRTAPGGERLLFLDGDSVRPAPGGERLLFVDGDSVRPEPGGERLLFLDGDDVRAFPGGPRLAFWDWPNLLRTPDGPVLLVVDGCDLRSSVTGPREAYLEDSDMGYTHLTALLYRWRPSLFQPSEAELAAAQEAIADGQRWDLEQAEPERDAGRYGTQMSGGGAWKASWCELDWDAASGCYALRSDHVSGKAIKFEDGGYRLIGGFGAGDVRVEFVFGECPELGESVDKGLNGFGSVHRLAGGCPGFAYRFGNDAVGRGVVIVEGAEAGVFDFHSDGGMINGDYYAGDANSGYWMLAR